LYAARFMPHKPGISLNACAADRGAHDTQYRDPRMTPSERPDRWRRAHLHANLLVTRQGTVTSLV
jgi:hypothetical protein